MADFNSDNAIIDEVLTNLQNNNGNSNSNTIINNNSNANLLINGDFSVWQRGTSFIAPQNIYTADRWRANGSGTVTFDGGYKVDGTVTITYTMEDLDFDKINNKSVTLSYQFKNEDIVTSTFTATSAVVCTLEITNKTLLWIKLELGENATPLIPKLYAEELALCQRYYENNMRLGSGKALGAEALGLKLTYVFCPFCVTKRVAPSCKIYPEQNDKSSGIRIINENKPLYYNNFVIDTSTTNILTFHIRSASVGTWYDFVWEADAEIY